MRGFVLFAGLLVIVAGVSHGQAAKPRPEVEKRLVDEAYRLASFAADPVVVRAIEEQNARTLTPEQISAIDEGWIEGRGGARIKAMLENPCSRRLRSLAAGRAAYQEIFAVDARGANVCMTHTTTDFFQGDEAKWRKSFNGGLGKIYVEMPDFDASVRGVVAHVSVPVQSGGKTIGVLVVGVDPERLSGTSPR
jgi:hypothetical protein